MKNVDTLTQAVADFECFYKDWENKGFVHEPLTKTIRAVLQAMLHIREISQPGQYIHLSEAIDIIGQIYTATHVKADGS